MTTGGGDAMNPTCRMWCMRCGLPLCGPGVILWYVGARGPFCGACKDSAEVKALVPQVCNKCGQPLPQPQKNVYVAAREPK